MKNEFRLTREKRVSKIRKYIFLWDELKIKQFIFLQDGEGVVYFNRNPINYTIIYK